MKAITEDYVSFETAKRLKEKGFDESCYTYYDDIDDTINRFDKGYHFNNTSYPWGVPYDANKAKKYVVAPTLQMVMKWLREKYKFLITIDLGIGVYVWTITNIDECTVVQIDAIVGSYEQTCEAAIKYCLENLI